MSIFKSHFSYSKSQRNGIFVLIILVVCLQGIILLYDFNNKDTSYKLSPVSQSIQKQLDSLSLLKDKKYQLRPFNPNYISDYKAYQLGLSVDEIDRLMSFRKQNRYVNSIDDFQRVTKISDSLLGIISPFFKFPDWVSKKSIQKIRNKAIVVKDINKVTVEELMIVSGIGIKRANTIIRYRNKLQGFSFNSQIDEVWGLPKDVLLRLKKEFKVLTRPNIQKRNVNELSVSQLLTIVYVDYALAKSIVNYRKEVAEIQSLLELKTISDFPQEKFDLISLYLQAY